MENEIVSSMVFSSTRQALFLFNQPEKRYLKKKKKGGWFVLSGLDQQKTVWGKSGNLESKVQAAKTEHPACSFSNLISCDTDGSEFWLTSCGW